MPESVQGQQRPSRRPKSMTGLPPEPVMLVKLDDGRMPIAAVAFVKWHYQMNQMPVEELFNKIRRVITIRRLMAQLDSYQRVFVPARHSQRD